MSKVSIITTTYNHEYFIRDTIESVISQTFSDWELIIGDDNSTDCTYEIIQEYTALDTRIKSYKHPKNIWLVENMNFLLSQVDNTSEYIAFLEWDDKFVLNNLEERLKIFSAHNDVILVDSNTSKIDKNSIIIPNRKRKWILWSIWSKRQISPWLHNFSLYDLLYWWNIFQSFWSVIIRKEIIFSVYPFINLDQSNKMFWPLDYFIWLQILPWKTWYHIDMDLFQYRVHANNYTKWVSVFSNQVVLLYEYIIWHYRDNQIIRICNFYINYNLMLAAFFSKEYIEVIKYWFISFKYNSELLFLERLWMIIGSILPRRLIDYFILWLKK